MEGPALRLEHVSPGERFLRRDEGLVPLLRWTLARGDLPWRRPPLRVEATAPRLLRVVSDGCPLVFGRVAALHAGVWLLAPASRSELRSVPPIPIAAIREVGAEPGSEAWLTAWARHFVHELARSAASALHPGNWQIAACHPTPSTAEPSARDRVVDLPATGPVFERWGLNGSGRILPARPFSRDDAGRVKAARKLARAGVLPPVLLLAVTGLDLDLILDGHDRLRAAQLEEVPAPLLVVASTREVRWEPDRDARAAVLRGAETALETATGRAPRTIAAINDRVMRAFDEPRWRSPRTRAHPLPGGRATWLAEVGARLDALGPGVDRTMLDLDR